MSLENLERVVGFVGIIGGYVVMFLVTKRWEKALKHPKTVTPRARGKLPLPVDKDGEEREDDAA